MQPLVAGIDIGGTNVVFGLVDSTGHILIRDAVKVKDTPAPEELIVKVSAAIKTLLSQLGSDFELIGAGIGAPNGNYYTGNVEFAPNLSWYGKVPVAKLFTDGLNCKSILTNDANAAALGEMLFGGAKGMKDFLFITLGTGLGSGIVVNGQMVYGHDGFAGEVGHVIVFPDGRSCGCGRTGCLETYCSATGIKTTYISLLKREHPTEIPDESGIDAEVICDKALQGDTLALESFNYTGEILGLALANSLVYTSPEAIFLFGGLANAGELIFKPTRDSFEKHVLNIYKNKVRLLPSQLQESDAAILGAASLIWQTHSN